MFMHIGEQSFICIKLNMTLEFRLSSDVLVIPNQKKPVFIQLMFDSPQKNPKYCSLVEAFVNYFNYD